jgi:uncharacterized membrane protein
LWVGGGGSFAEPRRATAEEPRVAATLADEKAPTFKTDVMPILKNSCVGCHNSKKAKGRVDLSTYDSVMKSVKASDADKSRLVKSVTGQGAKLMPPKNALPAEQVAILKKWIAAGAKND